jgi:hypothetical protein
MVLNDLVTLQSLVESNTNANWIFMANSLGQSIYLEYVEHFSAKPYSYRQAIIKEVGLSDNFYTKDIHLKDVPDYEALKSAIEKANQEVQEDWEKIISRFKAKGITIEQALENLITL